MIRPPILIFQKSLTRNFRDLQLAGYSLLFYLRLPGILTLKFMENKATTKSCENYIPAKKLLHTHILFKNKFFAWSNGFQIGKLLTYVKGHGHILLWGFDGCFEPFLNLKQLLLLNKVIDDPDICWSLLWHGFFYMTFLCSSLHCGYKCSSMYLCIHTCLVVIIM